MNEVTLAFLWGAVIGTFFGKVMGYYAGRFIEAWINRHES